MFCQKCGKELKENAKFCNYCGTSVSGEKPAQMTQEVQDESLGSKITSHIDNKVKMLVNDAMEFLYTYTWGEDSYPLEVQEQFGYLTPTQYKQLINKNLPNSKILVCKAFLQDGYEENLLNKIAIYDDKMNVVKLPNSTCIIVIEKGK